MTMRASLIIEARDRASAVFGRIGSRARQMGNSFKPVAREATNAERAIDRLGTQGSSRLRSLAAAARNAAGRAGLKALELGARGAGWALGSVTRMAATATAGLARYAAMAGSLGAGLAFGGIIRGTSEVEQFRLRLRYIEGSTVAAAAVMGRLRDLSRANGIELAGLTQTFIDLRNRGLNPTNDQLIRLSDIGVGMGKSISEASDIIQAATSGSFEDLRKAGLRVVETNDLVTLTLERNGERIRRTARKDSAALRAATEELLGLRYAGATEEQGRTALGIWNRIKATVADTFVMIGEAGVFDRLKARAETFLGLLRNAEGNPALQRWLEQLSGSMGALVDRAFDFIENTDWMAVANGLGAAVSTAITLFGWIGRLAQAYERFQWSNMRRNNLIYSANPFLSSEQRQAALRRAARADEEIRRIDGNLPAPAPKNDGKDDPRAPIGSGAPWFRRAPSRPPLSGGGGLSEPIGRRGFGSRPLASGAPMLKGATPRVPSARVGGSVDVRISAAPGFLASTARVTSTNPSVPLRVASRGPVRPGS